MYRSKYAANLVIYGLMCTALQATGCAPIDNVASDDGLAEDGGSKSAASFECTVSKDHVSFEDGSEDDMWMCELDPQDANGVKGIQLPLRSLPADFLNEHADTLEIGGGQD